MTDTNLENMTLKDQAIALLQQNRLDEACTLLTQACEADGNDGEAWFVLAGAQAALGNMQEVVNCCCRVIAINPQNAVAHYNMGLALQNLDRQPEAIQSFHTAVQIDQDFVQAHTSLGAALKDAGNYLQAEEALTNAINLGLDTPLLHYNLGLILADQEKYDEAEDSLLKAAALAPSHVDTCISLGNILLKKDEYQAAAEWFKKALDTEPENIGALFQLGATCNLAGKLEEATRCFLKILELDPANTAATNNLGKVYEQNGSLPEAEAMYMRALKTDPGNPVIHCNLGRTYVTDRKFKEAKSCFDKVISIDPDYTEAYFSMARILSEQGNREAATEFARKALAIDPNLEDARFFIRTLENLDATTDAVLAESVTKLFDDAADSFEDALTNKLEYRTPELIRELASQYLDTSRKYDIFDAGCGTGLIGPLFRDISETLTGVDLSSKMIGKSREKNVYDELIIGDIAQTLDNKGRKYDIIIATDVFIYIGDLKKTFTACSNALVEGGLFCFSTESDAIHDVTIKATGRYAHTDAYINKIAADTGFRIIKQESCTLRQDFGKPINGTLFVLARHRQSD